MIVLESDEKKARVTAENIFIFDANEDDESAKNAIGKSNHPEWNWIYEARGYYYS